MNKLLDMLSKWADVEHWSTKKRLTHLVVLLLLSILVSAVFYDKFANIDVNVSLSESGAARGGRAQSDFSHVPGLNRELLNAAQALAKAPQAEKSQALGRLRTLATERKNIIAKALAENDAEAVLTNTISPQIRANMPEEIKSLIEQPRQVRGVFEHVVLDDEEGEYSTEEMSVQDENTGRRVRAVLTKDFNFKAKTGDKVTIDGLALGDELVAYSDGVNVVESGPAPDLTATPKKLAVVLINLGSNTSQPWTVDQIRTQMFTGSASANAFYQENSYGQWSLTGKSRPDGDVFGWLKIPYDGTGCDFYRIRTEGVQALEASGVSISGYDNIMFAFPKTSQCSYGGWGWYGGTPGYSIINGYMMTRTPAHELGHNYYLSHANTYNCTKDGVRVAISDSCTSKEYGDPFSVMGVSGVYKHFHNYHKASSGSAYSPGWIASDKIYTINRSTQLDGVYTITPSTSNSDGVQVLRVPRDTSSYYYLELRGVSSFDNYSSTSAVVNGVSIRIAGDYATGRNTPSLIDTTPSTSGYGDAPLMAGKTFVDEAKGVTISTLSVTPESASVRVTVTGQPCSSSNPSISISPLTQNGSAGQTLTYRMTLKNNNGSTCAPASFNVTPSLPSGWSMSPTAFNETLNSGGSVARDFNITSSGSASGGSNSFSLTAVNSSAATYKATGSASFYVVQADSDAPVITISSPQDGSSAPSRGNMSISASATDSSGVASMTIAFNGKVISKRCTSSCSATVKSGSFKSGSNVITVTATDASVGAVTSTKTITVYK
jgi:hypothetical protein